jgi:hypothetical protein
MTEFFDQLLKNEPNLSWQAALLSLLLSFLLTNLLGAVYIWTYRGLSYSRSFVQSLVLGGVVATILLMAIGNSVARGLGLLGTLAMIRFRANLKDTRDMTFIFASLAIGVSEGVQSHGVGVLGTLTFGLLAVYLSFSSFGSRRQYDGLLRFQAPTATGGEDLLRGILREYCSSFILVNLREVAQGSRLEHAYQIKLSDPSFKLPLVDRLRSVPDLTGVNILLQDTYAEA